MAVNNEPWETEPNELKWTDEATGLTCLILRVSEMGHLCGYVRVPRRHTLYRKAGYGRAERRVQVHGGVTFQGEMSRKGGGKRRGHWVGFDCAHAWDLVPAFEKMTISSPPHGQYRDIAYVTGEVKSMARQVKAMAK